MLVQLFFGNSFRPLALPLPRCWPPKLEPAPTRSIKLLSCAFCDPDIIRNDARASQGSRALVRVSIHVDLLATCLWSTPGSGSFKLANNIKMTGPQ